MLQHNSTKKDKEERSRETGLSPMQEQAAILLAGGLRVTDVAERIKVNRTVLYTWQRQKPFKCFLTRQREEMVSSLINGLSALQGRAVETITRCLNSDNEAVAMKAAQFIIDRLTTFKTDEPGDIREALAEEAREETKDAFLSEEERQKAYEKKLEYWGLEK